MKWSMDTHKFMSEITRKALQIIAAHNITSESEPEDIEATERELASAGIYKDFEASKGRIRRALFTYFKAYGCMDDNEQLTEVGRLFVEEKLSVQEICFHYLLTYKYADEDGNSYFPVQLILNCVKKLYERGAGNAYISPYDFSRLVECNDYFDITDEFIDELIEARKEQPADINERAIGFDVWSNMLQKSGIFDKTVDRTLVVKDGELVKWILNAYDFPQNIVKGHVVSGPLEYLPILKLDHPSGNAAEYENEGKALQAFLFTDDISKGNIERYIFKGNENGFRDMLTCLGISNAGSFYKHFYGLERLVGHCLANNTDSNISIIGNILASIKLTKSEMMDAVELGLVFKTGIRANKSRNRIIFGAPGTGKSFLLNKERKELLGADNETDYERVTFHPDYSYANFVGTYKPVMVSNRKIVADKDTDYVISILNDEGKTAQEKYDVLYERFKDDGLTRLPVLLGLYTDEVFKTRKQDGTDAVGDNSVERNHGRAIRKYVSRLTGQEASSDIAYEYVPGPFIRVYVNALKSARSANPKPYLLLIEEINRANVAAVFGDIFQLLDRDENEVSEYPIQASEDIKKYLAKELGGNPEDYNKIKIPDNMFIWATMNSADQGVFPMDTAFKRRWDFTYIGIDDNDEEIRGKYVILGNGTSQKVEWNKLRKAINRFLAKKGINEDKQLGPYFLSRKVVIPENGDEIDRDRFCEAFKNKVIMYLFEDAAKQKRPSLFEGCFDSSSRYSEICKEFDEKGVGIFNHEIGLDTDPEDRTINETEAGIVAEETE